MAVRIWQLAWSTAAWRVEGDVEPDVKLWSRAEPVREKPRPAQGPGFSLRRMNVRSVLLSCWPQNADLLRLGTT